LCAWAAASGCPRATDDGALAGFAGGGAAIPFSEVRATRAVTALFRNTGVLLGAAGSIHFPGDGALGGGA